MLKVLALRTNVSVQDFNMLVNKATSNSDTSEVRNINKELITVLYRCCTYLLERGGGGIPSGQRFSDREAVYFITRNMQICVTPWQCSHRLVLRFLNDEFSSSMFWPVWAPPRP